MADNDGGDELKSLEEELFKEFNEQVNLTEPTDSRLGDAVDLNPSIKKEEKKEEKVEADPVSEKKEEASPEKEEVALGNQFSDFVGQEQLKEAEKESVEEQTEEVAKESSLKKHLEKYKALLLKLPSIFSKFKIVFQFLFKPIKWFFALNIKEKVFFVFMLLIAGVSIALSRYFYVEFVVNKNKSPYLLSFDELPGEVSSFSNEEPFEVFFSPAYTPDYIFALPKIMANIRPSRTSGRNPMIFIEVVLKASNKETAVEFKDRSIEMQDVIARTLESFSFDELRVGKGKEKLKMKIIRDVNRVLSQGTTVDVLYKSFIVKP